MNQIPLIILTLLSTVCISSCTFQSALDAQGNVTVKPQGKLLVSYGQREFKKLKKHKAISHDPKYTLPTARVAERLQQVIHLPDAQWEFVVFKDASPNAFALPGGKVGINTGLFTLIDNDAMLAAVLSHEIAHATSAHARQRMTHALVTLIAGIVLYHVLENNDVKQAEQAIVAYALSAYLLDSLPLSRRQEYESDRIGAIYMAKAGYDPRQSIELWKKLSHFHQHHGHHKPEFLRTHPADHKRIRSLVQFMPIALRYYQKNQIEE